MVYLITTAHGTIREHQAHEMKRRTRYLSSLGIAYTIETV